MRLPVGADVLLQELEDFTTPERRQAPGALAADLFARWRGAGIVAAVRINSRETEGRSDLRDRVMMPSATEIREARAIIAAFGAGAAGKERARQGDLLIEVPATFSAKRLLARAAALGIEGA
jgi:citrate lyase beta subunit